MKKCTPGPWKLGIAKHAIKRGEGFRYFVFAAVKQMDNRDRNDRFLFQQILSRVDDIELHQEAEANATLIAAAPDLYAACELALTELEHFIPVTDVKVIDALRNALKKANQKNP